MLACKYCKLCFWMLVSFNAVLLALIQKKFQMKLMELVLTQYFYVFAIYFLNFCLIHEDVKRWNCICLELDCLSAIVCGILEMKCQIPLNNNNLIIWPPLVTSLYCWNLCSPPPFFVSDVSSRWYIECFLKTWTRQRRMLCRWSSDGFEI